MAFSYYKQVSIDHTQVGSSDSANFPMGLILDGNVQAADADLKTVGNGGYVQNSNGYDIRPYADSALTTPLTFELVYYDGANGKLEMWVNIPTVSHSSDTVIYLAFGDSGISTDGSSTSTWDANYAGVFHLKDGSTLAIGDSTSNANAMTNHGATAAVGQIDGGAAFASGSTQYISGPTTGSLDITGYNITISYWFKLPDTSAEYKAVSRWGGPFQYLLEPNNIGKALLALFGTGFNVLAGNTSFSTGVWYHLVAVQNSSNTFIYVNGSQDNSNASPISLNTQTVEFDIGRATDGGYLNGTLDEVRVSNINRVPDWITTEYNNEKASATILVWGTKTAVGGITIKIKKGVAQASVKTYKGLATASTKTDKGLANV